MVFNHEKFKHIQKFKYIITPTYLSYCWILRFLMYSQSYFIYTLLLQYIQFGKDILYSQIFQWSLSPFNNTFWPLQQVNGNSTGIRLGRAQRSLILYPPSHYNWSCKTQQLSSPGDLPALKTGRVQHSLQYYSLTNVLLHYGQLCCFKILLFSLIF